MKETKASIAIQAAPQEVWQVLTDLDRYHEWNPMMVHAKGTIAVGESLDLRMRLPARIFCGAPVSCSWSPKIAKVEPNSCLEWSGMKGFIDRTHYFQLSSTHGGTATEFTQGERYSGWGMGLFSSFGSLEDARRGFIIMNNALQHETVRRKSIAEKTGSSEKEGRDKEEEIAQLDISDPAAVAASGVMKAAAPEAAAIAADDHQADDTIAEMEDIETAAGDVTVSHSPEPSSDTEEPVVAPNMTERSMEKSEKRTSIIGAVSSLFISSKPSPTPMPASTSKDELFSKAVPEEEEEEEEEEGEDSGDDGDDEVGDGTVCGDLVEDVDVKKERDAKNAERIELDLGLSDMDLSDFGF
ncbi:hypothetical protein BGZ75_008948 [Mortierella antarctica]|nr:hypothetical protein BGZ75_008948 [Mortierella antarctica]